ncbi:MAG: signal peptidase I [Ktedonobacterales bacterium]
MRQKTKAPPSYRTLMQRAHLKREIVETLLFVVIIFLVVHVSIQTFLVSDASMLPALKNGELVIVNKASYFFGGPARGDVVLFYDPHDLTKQYVARVIAIPGDTITVAPDSIILDGKTLNEPYISVPDGASENPTIVPQLTLGPGQYFVLNDSRVASSDSRTFGAIPRNNIVGKAVLVFWPLSRFGGISTFPNVFSSLSK